MDPATITVYRDGPLLVRGPVTLLDQDGAEIVIDRETVALCRCGKSRMRPICDGSHRLVRFRAPGGLEADRAQASAGAAARLGASSSEDSPRSQAAKS